MLAPLACAALRSALGGARSLSAFAQVHAEPCSDSWELPRPGIKRAAQPWHAPLPGDHQLSSSGPAAAAAAAAPRAGHRFPTATATEHVTEFHSVLSLYRSRFPDALWSRIQALFPRHAWQHPMVVDVVVGSEGRAGVELAKRGFRVRSITSDAASLNKTFRYALDHDVALELVTAKVEQDVVREDEADMVTCMHGFHLLDTRQALQEAWRILKPGGKLVVAWNDRDLNNDFIDALERVIECHVPGYSRSTRQHYTQAWAPRLQEGGLFRLVDYDELPNPILLRDATLLRDMLNSQSFARHLPQGPARAAFNSDVRALVQQRFGQGLLLLQMQTRMFVLERCDLLSGPSSACAAYG